MLSHPSFDLLGRRERISPEQAFSFGKSVPGLASHFACWSELERFLEHELLLESVSISLQRKFAGPESAQGLGSLSVCSIDRRSNLVELSVGYRTRLVAYLTRSSEDVRPDPWPPSSFNRFIVRAALDIYANTVSNQIVELISGSQGGAVASIYFDGAGRVESASGEAKAFCRLFCLTGDCEGDYFPVEIGSYVRELTGLYATKASRGENAGIVFAIGADERIVNCLVRRAGDGFLLSLCVDV